MASRRFLRCRCNRPEFPPSQFFPRGKTGPAHSFPREKTDWSDFSPPSQFFPPLYFFRICNSKYPLCGKLGQPLILPLRPKQKWCFVVNYWGGEKLGRPVLSPSWKVKASTLCRWLSGWRKTGPAHSFPTLTSENITHTLSWICKQSLHFRGWGKTRPAHSFPTPTR